MNRRAFLNLHLSFSDAGYFRAPHAASFAPHYCYSPPAYSLYIEAHPTQEPVGSNSVGGKKPEQPTRPQTSTMKQEEENEPDNGFTPYVQGMSIWKLLLEEEERKAALRAGGDANARAGQEQWPARAQLPFIVFEDALFELVDSEVSHRNPQMVRERRSKPSKSRKRSSDPPPAGPPAPLATGPLVHVELLEHAQALLAVVNGIVEEYDIKGETADEASPDEDLSAASASRAPSPAPANGRQSPAPRKGLRLRHRWPKWHEHVGESTRKRNLLTDVLRRSGGAARAFLDFQQSMSDAMNDAKRKRDSTPKEPVELTYAQMLEAWRSKQRYSDLTFPYNVIARPIGQISRPPGEGKRLGERRDVEEMLCFMRVLDGEDEGCVRLEDFCDAMSRPKESLWDRMLEVQDRHGRLSPAPAPYPPASKP